VEDIKKEKTGKRCTKEGRELGGMHATGGGTRKGLDSTKGWMLK
jgi:hypothetical protein